jgi:multiple sugar transport system substrate-binding protein
VADFMPIFWAFGGEMFDPSGKPAVNSPEGIAALQFMIELGKYSPPGYVSFNASDVGAHLLQGTAAMSINWPVWISPFSDPAKSRVIGKMEFTTLPSGQKQGQAEIGNWLIAIPRDSRNATDETISATRESTDAQIALQRCRTAGEESGVPGAVAFTRKLTAATAHTILERD